MVDENARRNHFMHDKKKFEANRKFMFLQCSFTQQYKANYYQAGSITSIISFNSYTLKANVSVYNITADGHDFELESVLGTDLGADGT